MADNENTAETGAAEVQPIKSTTDLEIEQLKSRLDALESENRELRNANQGLWASLHPVQESAAAVEAQQPDTDGAFDSFAAKIGLKPKEV